jgi:hypothetical protein
MKPVLVLNIRSPHEVRRYCLFAEDLAYLVSILLKAGLGAAQQYQGYGHRTMPAGCIKCSL